MPQGRPATFADLIRVEAEALKIHPDLAIAIAEQESSLDPTARSPKGAIGLFQLMPETAQELGVDPSDPVQNIRGGLRYLRQHLDKYGGDVQKALAAYNMGPTAYDRSGGRLYPETATYVRSVLGRLARSRQAPLQPPPAMAPAVSHDVATPPPVPLWQKLLRGVDPRTREGRRNIAGGIGAVGGTILAMPTATVSGPIGPATGGALGAMVAGGAVEAGERFLEGFVGTPPPLRESIAATGAAMTEQGMYEMGGRAIIWPFRLVGRRIAATSVARQAKASLQATRKRVETELQDLVYGAADALRAARQAAKLATEATAERLRPRVRGVEEAARDVRTTAASQLRQARQAGREAVGQTAEQLRSQVRSVEQAAELSVRGAEQTAEAARLAPQAAYEQLVGVPPAQAGQTAQRVIRGPAKTARDEIGQMVDEAAKGGPDVDIRALKDEAMRIFEEEIRPAASRFQAKPIEQVETRGARIAAPGEFGPGLSPAEIAKKRALAEEAQKALRAAEAELAQTTLKHPAMKVVGGILNEADVVPFSVAHQFKRELDDAIGTAWDREVKSRVMNITKHLRTTLRASLTGHEPYNLANAAYEAIAPLYTKGINPRFRKVAEEAPGALVDLIGKGTTARGAAEAQMLHDLLVAQPAKVGEEQAGQAAWDAVRSAWAYERLVRSGSLETLGERLNKLTPEFVDAMFGDPSGQAVFANYRSLSQAYLTAVERGKALVEATGDVAKSELRAARDAAAAQLRQVRTEARAGVERVGEQVRPQVRAAQQAVQATRDAAAAEIRQTRRAGQATIQPLEAQRIALGRQQKRAHALTPQEQAFLVSKLGRSVQMTPGGGMGAETDVLRVIMLNPQNPWWMTSFIRMLNAPSSKEIIHWAALSSTRTQRVVSVLTSPYPGMAIADLLRATDIGRPFIDRLTEHFLGELGEPRPVPSHQVGEPPPPR